MEQTGGRRDVGIDLVRGLALLSMYVAHTAPTAGPGEVFLLSEYLTAPLFAMLVGVGLALSARRGSDAVAPALLRGSVLVLVGLLLEGAGSHVVVVLVYLGVLTWVMAGLVRLPSVALGGVAAFLYLVSPLLLHAWTNDYIRLAVGGDPLQARLMAVLFTGPEYRLTAFVVYAAIGVLVARHLLTRSRHRRTSLRLGAAALLAAGLLLGGFDGALGMVNVVPYSGTHVEILFDALLATGVLLVGCSLAERLPSMARSSVTEMGRMSLTLYTLQILWLAFVVRVLWPGRTDDAWSVLASLVAGSLAIAYTWNRVSLTRAVGRGPLEGAVDGLIRLGAPRRRVGV